MSTICLPPVVPESNRDSLNLHRCFQGVGCDGRGIITVLAHRDSSQRAKIREVYKNMFQEVLCQRIKRELHGNFKAAMLLWMHEPADRDAMIIKDALRCVNPTRQNRILAEIFCTRSVEEIHSITNAYASQNKGKSLLNEIESRVIDPPSRELFILYLHSNVDDAIDLEPQHAFEEARNLYNAGEGLSTHIDEATYLHTLTTRNQKQLHSILNAYRSLYKHNVDEGLKLMKKRNNGTATKFQKTIEIITECVANPADYFSKVLYTSMKGLGTDNQTLIRVIVTRAEIDMADIKITFLHRYKKTLHEWVTFDTSGNCRSFLIALIGV